MILSASAKLPWGKKLISEWYQNIGIQLKDRILLDVLDFKTLAADFVFKLDQTWKYPASKTTLLRDLFGSKGKTVNVLQIYVASCFTKLSAQYNVIIFSLVKIRAEIDINIFV